MSVTFTEPLKPTHVFKYLVIYPVPQTGHDKVVNAVTSVKRKKPINKKCRVTLLPKYLGLIVTTGL